MTRMYKLRELFACGEEDGNDKPDYAALFQAPEAQEYVNSLLGTKISEAVARETEALKKKNSELLDEKKKIDAQRKAILSAAENDADADALKTGKISFNELLDKRVAANNSTWEERLQGIESEKSEIQKRAEESERRLKQYQLESKIGQEALKNEFFQPSAIEDLLSYAASQCQLTDDGDIVFRDKSGNVRIGKNGKPLSAGEWIQSLTHEKPHYYKPMPGSGSKGSGGQGGQRTMTTKEWQSMLATANAEDQKKMLAARASGELRITQ